MRTCKASRRRGLRRAAVCCFLGLGFLIGCKSEHESAALAELESIDQEFAVADGTRPPFFRGANLDPFWSEDAALVQRDALRVSAFACRDQNDAVVTQAHLNGRITVASFFFTHCSGICPLVTSRLKKVAAVYAAAPEVGLISFSVTPDLDTPDTLFQFARKFNLPDERWRLLTGDRAAIYALARDVFQADTRTSTAHGPADFLHSENVYLLDHAGRIRGVYNGNSELSVNELIADIARLRARP